MSRSVIAELSVGESEATMVRRRQTAGASKVVRVRLPYRFTPNPIAGEREYLSVVVDAFQRLRSRGMSLHRAMRGELELLGGDVDAWISDRRAIHRLRHNADLWKTMVLGAVLDAGSDAEGEALVAAYFDGRESLGFAVGRLVGIQDPVALTHFELHILNSVKVPLDRLSTQAVARLRWNAILHATRTADNARAGEIFMFCFFAVVGFFELGGAELLAFLVRIRAPFWIGEGFGEAAGTQVPLMQGIFGAFMGFVGYTEEVGKLLEKEDVGEKEANALLLPLVGIVLPAVFGVLSLNNVSALAKKIGQLALLPFQVVAAVVSAIHKFLWLVSSLQELMESYSLCREVADNQGTSFLVGRDEFEIILPGMPE